MKNVAAALVLVPLVLVAVVVTLALGLFGAVPKDDERGWLQR